MTFNNRLLYCHGRWSQQSSSLSSSNCSELTEALNSCSDMNQQIQELVARTELDDAGIRARFFLCDVVESLIKVGDSQRCIKSDHSFFLHPPRTKDLERGNDIKGGMKDKRKWMSKLFFWQYHDTTDAWHMITGTQFYILTSWRYTQLSYPYFSPSFQDVISSRLDRPWVVLDAPILTWISLWD